MNFSISTDRTLVATDAIDGFGAVMDITVRSLPSGDAIRRWSFPKESLKNLCFVDKSRLLMVGSDSGTLRILNPDTGEVLTRLNEGILSPILGFDCPANGGATVSKYAIPRGTIEWLSATLEPSGKFETGPGATLVASAALRDRALALKKVELAEQSPSLENLLNDEPEDTQPSTRYELLMVSAQNNAVIWQHELKEIPLDTVVIDPSGKVGAWIDEEGFLHIINTHDGKETVRVQIAPLSFPQFTFSDNGQFLAISEMGEWHSYVIDTSSGKIINQTQTAEILALKEDGNPLMLRKSGAEGIEIIFSEADAADAPHIKGRLKTPTLVSQPLGRLFLSGQNFDYLFSVKDRKITQLLKPGEVIVTVAASMTPDAVLRIYERSDGDFSIGTQDGKDELARLPPKSRGLAVAASSGNYGLLIASVNTDDLEQIKTAVDAWSNTLEDKGELAELNRVLTSTNTTLYQLDFSGTTKKIQSFKGAVSAMEINDDQTAIARFQAPNLQVFDAESGRSEFKTAISDVTTSIRFSPTRSWIAFTRDSGIEVWDWHKDSVVTKLSRERAQDDGFEFSADGKSLIYADGASVHITALSSPRPQRSPEPSQEIISYNADGAVQAITPLNDRFFAGISSSGAVNVWKIGQSASVARIVFEKNGTWTVFDNKGRFDTSSIETNRALHVLSTGSVATQLNPSDCRDSIWVPGLLNEIFGQPGEM
jgi:WD40 repeat protein